MFVPYKYLNQHHPATVLCARGAEQKRRRLEEKGKWKGGALTFKAYGQTLVMVSLFRYLGKTQMAVDYDWPAFISHLHKAQKEWAQLSRILGSEGADTRMTGAVLNCSRSVKTDIWLRYLGVEPPHGADPGVVAPLGGKATHK